MFGLIISIALGAVMVGAALSAARSGELTVGEGTRLRRGELLFAPAVGLLGLMGAGLWSFAGYVALSEDASDLAPKAVGGDGWAADIPGGWSRMSHVEEAFGGGAVVYGDGGADVVFLVTSAPRPTDDPRPLRTQLEAFGTLGDDLSTRRTRVEMARALAFDGQHMTPRGLAYTRLIAFGAGEKLSTVQAICTDDTGAGLCPPVIASLRLILPEESRLPLTMPPAQPGR